MYPAATSVTMAKRPFVGRDGDSDGCDLGESRSGGNLELRRERAMLGLDLGIGEQAGLEFFEFDGHVTSFARRGASSSSARGVFCVFFTNARTTTTLRPIAVT
jgi:hypothetical protein